MTASPEGDDASANRWHTGFAMAALWVAANAFGQDAPAPLVEDPLPGNVARISVFVPPDYPEAALRESVAAVVDVVGTVRSDGSIAISRIDAQPDREDFRKEVRDVSRWWIFR